MDEREQAPPRTAAANPEAHGASSGEQRPLPPAIDLRSLTPAQTRALAVLGEGGSVEEAAAAAGRDRRTVWRWKRYHPEFRAELNRRLNENDLRDRALAQRIRNAGLRHLLERVEDGDMYAINLVARTSRIFDVRLDAESLALEADDLIDELVDREMDRSRVARTAAAAAGSIELADTLVETRADVEARVEADLVVSLLDALPAAPELPAEGDVDLGDHPGSVGEPEDRELDAD